MYEPPAPCCLFCPARRPLCDWPSSPVTHKVGIILHDHATTSGSTQLTASYTLAYAAPPTHSRSLEQPNACSLEEEMPTP